MNLWFVNEPEKVQITQLTNWPSETFDEKLMDEKLLLKLLVF